jgi:predicted esterase
LEVAERDVTWVYSQVREQKGVDKSKIVLAGFSQGAALAIYLSLKKAFPCKGFFAVAPSDWVMPEKQRAIERDRPSRAYLEFVQSTDARGVRGQILIGEKDPFLKKMEFLKEEMVRRGLECNYSVEPRIGHEYPQDFGGKLRKAVNFVLEMS